MSENGSPDPVFETDEDRSYFLVRFPVHPYTIGANESEVQGGVQEGVQEGVQDAPRIDLNDMDRRILNACGDSPRGASQILEILGYRSRSRNFRKSLNRLLDSQILERTLKNAPRSRNQKYRLTRLGEKLLGADSEPQQ